MEARSAQALAPRASTANAKRVHGMLAGFILIFIAIHFATHFTALGGPQSHAAALDTARVLYQFPLVEVVLVLALAAQVALGLRLLTMIRKRVRKGFWHKVQFLSGAYLAIFIVLHTTAAVSTRLAVGLDTNFYWAAGTLAIAPLKYGFAPYYVLAVTAIVSHLLAAAHFRRSLKWHAPALAIGPLLGIVFVLGYGGALVPFDLPQAYFDYYVTLFGIEP